MAGSDPAHVAVISGATRGLGRVTAEHCARSGSAVALCARNGAEAAEVAAALAAEHGVATYGAGVDVSDRADVNTFARSVTDRLGQVDLLINNAAVLGPVGPLGTIEPHDWSTAIDINVKGCAQMTASFGPMLARSSRGRVINLSGGGVGGPTPMERTSAYVVSKYAVVALTECLAPELAEVGVTINAIAPGAFPTDFMAGVVDAGPQVAGQALFDDASQREGDIDAHMARPFLDLLDYLASESGAWLTGRMVSARWETPARLEQRRLDPRGAITDNTFRLRRIDDDLFAEVSQR